VAFYLPRARSNPPSQFFVQDEEKGLLILQMPVWVPCNTGLRSIQGADHGLRIPLDDGQVGTDGDLRPPPALLPILQ